MNDPEIKALQELVARQADLIDRLTARVQMLEAHPAPSVQVTAGPEPAEEIETSRRGFLRLAGVAAAGAAAVVVGNAMPAAAADNGSILQGSSQNVNNTATSMTTLTSNGTPGLTNAAFKAVGPTDSVGVWGVANGAAQSATSTGVGVYGTSDKGYGVIGESGSGLDLYAGGTGRLAFRPAVASGPPTTGTHLPGEVIVEGANPGADPTGVNGTLWVCVTGGTPGTWRKLGGPTTAGQLHLVTAVRVLDSRALYDQPGGGGLPNDRIVNTQERVVNCANFVPSGTKAVVISLSALSTQSAGYFTVFPTGTSNPRTVNCSWSTGVQASATTTVGLNSSRQFSVTAQLDGAGVMVTADLLGYYI